MVGSLLFEPGKEGVLGKATSRIAGKKARAHFRTRREAEKWHSERLALAQNGKLEGVKEKRRREEAEKARDAAETLDALVDTWLARNRPRLAGKTHADYRGLAAAIRRCKIDKSVRSFDQDTADRLFDELKNRGGARGEDGSPMSSSAVRKSKVLLSKALDDAVRLKIVAGNPLRGYELSSLEPSTEREPPSLEEVRMLLGAAVGRNVHFRIPIALASGCGMRAGEILALRWANVDLSAAEIKVLESVDEYDDHLGTKPPKTKRSQRPLAIPPYLVDLLRAHRLEQSDWALNCGSGYRLDLDLVCPTPDGTLWRTSTFSGDYGRFHRSLGVEPTFHDLRHFHASQLNAAGVDWRTISNRLGHSSPSFTISRYVHSGSESDRRAAAVFDAFYRGQGPSNEAKNDGDRARGEIRVQDVSKAG